MNPEPFAFIAIRSLAAPAMPTGGNWDGTNFTLPTNLGGGLVEDITTLAAGVNPIWVMPVRLLQPDPHYFRWYQWAGDVPDLLFTRVTGVPSAPAGARWNGMDLTAPNDWVSHVGTLTGNGEVWASLVARRVPDAVAYPPFLWEVASSSAGGAVEVLAPLAGDGSVATPLNMPGATRDRDGYMQSAYVPRLLPSGGTEGQTLIKRGEEWVPEDSGAALPKATNALVDAETDDTRYMTVLKTYRAIARKVRDATTTVRGIVLIARNADVDSTLTDTTRVPDVAKMIRYVARILGGYAALGGAAFTGPVTGQDPTAANQFATRRYVDQATGGGPMPSDTENHIGVSDDTDISVAELAAATSGTSNALEVPTYVGDKYVFFLRPASAGAISTVYIYQSGHRNTLDVSAGFDAVDVTLSGNRYLGIISKAALAPDPDTIFEVA